MVSAIELAFAWLLCLTLPVLASGMFYRAWKSRSTDRSSFSTSQRGDSPLTAGRPSRHYMVINAVCGVGLYLIFAAILLGGLEFAIWSGMAALIVWTYFIAIRLLGNKQAAE